MGRRSRFHIILSALAVVVTTISALPGSGGPASSAPSGKSPREFFREARRMRDRAEVRPQHADDHVVARFSSDGAANQAGDRTGSSVLSRIAPGAVTLSVPEGETVASFLKRLRGLPGVAWAEPDYRVEKMSQTVDWGVQAIKAVEATDTNGATGAGALVAVVDTGVDYTHEDLDANIWNNDDPVNGADDDGNGFVDDLHGYDFIGKFFTSTEPDSDPMDVADHGTHVAGIVAAEDNDIGVRGVAPEAEIMAVRVLDDVGVGFDTTVAAGIRYGVDNGAHIINLSLGSYARSSIMREAVEYADANGVAVVAAAGNFFFYSLASYPAGHPTVISVTAARRADLRKVWWSDWGHADFIAPGERILSTTIDDTYSRFSGTSMAAPHVAGALALVKDINTAFDDDQLHQALASTAEDLYFPGKDEVSGSGLPDAEAATGTLLSSIELYRSRYLIPSDGETGSTITARILTAAGLPGAGTVTFTTDKGTVTPATPVTLVGGEVSTVLKVDDDFGSATVTATATSVPAVAPRSIRIIVEDDRVRLDDAHFFPLGGEGPPIFDDPEPPEDEEPPEESSAGLEWLIPQPGDDVVLVGYLGRHNFDFASADAQIEFSVTDPDGDPVPDLTSSIEPGSVWGFGGQIAVDSPVLTVPFDAEPGYYTLTATAETTDTGETHTLTKTFPIGVDAAEVLVVNGTLSFDAETFNFLWPHVTDSAVRQAVEASGRSFNYWPIDVFGIPSEDVLLAHSTVIWLGGWDADLDLDAVTSYVDAGGNLVVSGELYAGFDRLSRSRIYPDVLQARGLLTTRFPDRNHQQYPSETSGVAGGLFEGVTFDLDSYDLNHANESTAIFDDELVLNAANGAETLLTYGDGIFDPAVAGVYLDDGFSRTMTLGFGLEAIDDGASPSTLGETLDTILGEFAPPMALFGVLDPVVDNSGLDGVLVEGQNLQPAGVTEVYVGTRRLRDVEVFDREILFASVPRGFPLGTYDLRVVNPDGTEDTLADAVEIVLAPPVVGAVSPRFVSNDRDRAVLVRGHFFRPGSRVLIEGRRVPTIYHSSTQLKAIVPRGFGRLGKDDVEVVNPDGQSDERENLLLLRYGFTFDLRRGMSHDAVIQLQKRLRTYGFYPKDAPYTRNYGDLTHNVVRRFQRRHHLTDTGVLNRGTRNQLNNMA